MGTDINLFVEYDESDQPPFSEQRLIRSVSEGCLSLERDYGLFDAVGGGRGVQLNPPNFEVPLIVPARGIPSPLGLAAARHFFALVCGTNDSPHPLFWPPDATVSSDAAEDLICKGCSSGKIRQDGWFGQTPPRIWQAIARPFWRTPSWLSPAEFGQAIEAYCANGQSLQTGWSVLQVIVSKMVSLTGEERVRLVFWFDS